MGVCANPREAYHHAVGSLGARVGKCYSAHWAVGTVSLLLGLVAAGFLTNSISDRNEVSSISELYVLQGTGLFSPSRMPDELAFNDEAWGVSLSHYAMFRARDGGNAVSKESFLAAVDAFTPVHKVDESAKCAEIDAATFNAAAVRAKCAEAPYASASLPCNCAAVAGNPDMISVNASFGGTTVELNVEHVCDAIPVPAALKPAGAGSYRPAEPGFETLSVYSPAFRAELQRAAVAGPLGGGAAAEPGATWAANADSRWGPMVTADLVFLAGAAETASVLAGTPEYHRAYSASLVDTVLQLQSPTGANCAPTAAGEPGLPGGCAVLHVLGDYVAGSIADPASPARSLGAYRLALAAAQAGAAAAQAGGAATAAGQAAFVVAFATSAVQFLAGGGSADAAALLAPAASPSIAELAAVIGGAAQGDPAAAAAAAAAQGTAGFAVVADAVAAAQGIPAATAHAEVAVGALVRAAGAGALAARTHFASEGNVVASQFQATAQCVADYAEVEGSTIDAPQFVLNQYLASSLAQPVPAGCPYTACGRTSCVAKDAIFAYVTAALQNSSGDFAGVMQTPAGTALLAGEYLDAVLGTMLRPLPNAASPESISADIDPIIAALMNRRLAEGGFAAPLPAGSDVLSAMAAGSAAFVAALPDQAGAAAAFVAAFAAPLGGTTAAQAAAAELMTPTDPDDPAGTTFAAFRREAALIVAVASGLRGADLNASAAALGSAVLGHANVNTAKAALGYGDADVQQVLAALTGVGLPAGELGLVNCGLPGLISAAAGTLAEYNFRGRPDAQGRLQAPASFSKQYWDRATVGFTAPPLPKTWGVDRFPCTVGQAVHMFREGDYDYPYNLKLLDQVGWQSYAFLFSDPWLAGHRAQADCVQKAAIDPLKAALYWNPEAGVTFDYQKANFPAWAAAEQKFAATLGNRTLHASPTETQQAAGLAAAEFLLRGGDRFDAGSAQFTLQATLVRQLGNGSAALVGGATAQMLGAAATGQAPSTAAKAAVWFAAARTAAGTPTGVADAAATLTPLLADLEPFPANATLSTMARAAAATAVTTSDPVAAAAITAARMGLNVLEPWFAAVATAAATAAGAEFQLKSQQDGTCSTDGTVGGRTGTLETFFTIFGTIGFSWRPSLGAHWQFDAAEEAEVDPLLATSDALKVYYYDYAANGIEFNPAMCFLGNFDYQGHTGDRIRTCLTPWTGPGLAMLTPTSLLGRIEYNVNSGSPHDRAASGLKSVAAHRMSHTDFAAENWIHSDNMKALFQSSAIGADTIYGFHDSIELLWQKEWLTRWDGALSAPCWLPGNKCDHDFSGVKLDSYVSRSTADAVKQAQEIEWSDLAVVYAVVLLYVASSLLGWASNVKSHFLLGLYGVVVVALAVTSALGASVLLEIPWTPIASGVMPFIALGIGIDDMLVVATAYATSLKLFDGQNPRFRDRYDGGNVQLLIMDVLAEALPSILFTSLTNFVAFGFASLVPIVVTETFCQLMMLAIVFNVVFIVLMLVPVMYWDAVRVLTKRRQEFWPIAVCYNTDESNCTPAKACAPAAVLAAKGNSESASQRLIGRYYAPFLMHPVTKTAVLVLSCAFFGAQLYMGATQMEEGTRQSDLFASGTYQYDFQAPFEQMFGYLPSTYVQRSAAFEDPAVQVALQMGARSHPQARLVAKSQVGVGTGSSWVASVAAQGAPDCTGANTVKIKTQPQNMCALDASDAATETEYAYSPAAEFYPRFAAYLGGTGALSAGSFVCKRTSAAAATRAGCEAGGGTFVGSKFGAYCRVSCFEVGAAWAAGGPRDVVLHAARSSVSVDGLTSIDRYKEGIRTCREQVDPCSSAYSTGAIGALPSWAASNGTTPGAVDPAFWAYPTGYFYQYYDQYLYIAKLLKEALLLGIAGIFVASFLFTLSWRSSLCLMICVTFSVVELIGVIPESSLTLEDPGLRLNAFSLVNIIACIGMAVEFTAHILHQFIAEPNAASSPGEDRQRRVIHAMTFMGPPIVHGVVTTLISTAFLATNDMRFIFEYYFFMFFVMVLIASFNGLVLLPVLLSLIGEGPMALDEDHATDVKKSPGRKSMQMVVLGAGVDDLPPRSPGAAPGPYYAAHVF